MFIRAPEPIHIFSLRGDCLTKKATDIRFYELIYTVFNYEDDKSVHITKAKCLTNKRGP